MNPSRIVILSMLVLFPFLSSSTVLAMPIVNTDPGDSGNLLSISNLELMGMTFDIDFQRGSFEDVFGDANAGGFMDPIPVGDDALHQALADAVAGAGAFTLFAGEENFLMGIRFPQDPPDRTFIRAVAWFDNGATAAAHATGLPTGNGVGLTTDFSAQGDDSWAVVRKGLPPQTGQVPEPSSFLVWTLLAAISGWTMLKRPTR